MRIFQDFAQWFQTKDRNAMDFHLKKDTRNLQKTLQSLNDELNEMKSIQHKLDILISKARQFPDIKDIKVNLLKEETADFQGWLQRTEDKLDKIFAKKAEDLQDDELQLLKAELPRLLTEQRRLANRIQKILEIIAKTRFLIDDLNEDLCKQLSGGRSLAEVGETLLHKFSREFREDYFSGKEDIIAFLEDHYKISKKSAIELFNLLEETGTIVYHIEIPENIKNQPLLYYGTDWDDPMMDYVSTPVELFGFWEIKS